MDTCSTFNERQPSSHDRNPPQRRAMLTATREGQQNPTSITKERYWPETI